MFFDHCVETSQFRDKTIDHVSEKENSNREPGIGNLEKRKEIDVRLGYLERGSIGLPAFRF